MKILVTGGAGFIGSNFVLDWIHEAQGLVVNLDKLTYAGNLANLESIKNSTDHVFVQGDIGDAHLVKTLLERYRPSAIVNFAAESHVDRSIHSPGDFIQTNIVGVFNLLHETYTYWKELSAAEKQSFRFLQVSTDEVYGSLGSGDPAFTEVSRYQPNSPYAASKASSDHLVRSYFHTYGFPTLTTNCSNNYGPFQFPEKLIPLMILNALSEKPLPVYGNGKNIRDWLFVKDHCDAIKMVLKMGRVGEIYNIGGRSEMSNIDVVTMITGLLDKIRPRKIGKYDELIRHVADRPGHDLRYAIDPGKVERELGWKPRENFQSGLEKTVHWFLDNKSWLDNIMSGNIKTWFENNYVNRK